MDIPVEMLVDYMSYMNPEIRLAKRDNWVSGIRLLPEYGRLDPACLYFVPSGSTIPHSRRCPIVLTCPKGETVSPELRDCIILHTNAPVGVIFNELLGIQGLIRSWGQEVEVSISKREGLQRLLDISTRVFGNPIAIISSALKTIAGTWELDSNDPAFSELLEQGHLTQDTYNKLQALGCFELDTMDGKTTVIQPSGILTAPMAFTAVTNNGSVGFFVMMLCNSTLPSRGTMQLYDAFMTKLLYYLTPAAESADFLENQFNYLIIDIIEGRLTSPLDIHNRNLFYPPAYTAEYNTVLIQHESNSVIFLEHAMQSLSALFPNVRQVLYHNQIILQPDLGDSEARRVDFLSTLEDYLLVSKAYAGISDTFIGMETLRDSYCQAKAALSYGKKLLSTERVELMLLLPNSPRSRVFQFREYQIYGIISGEDKDCTLLDLISRYDLDHNTDYYRILFVLLSFERSYTMAAELLHMHRNNVIYHTKRMSELFHLDLDDPCQRLRLLTLYRVRDLRPSF